MIQDPTLAYLILSIAREKVVYIYVSVEEIKAVNKYVEELIFKSLDFHSQCCIRDS